MYCTRKCELTMFLFDSFIIADKKYCPNMKKIFILKKIKMSLQKEML